MGLSGKLSNLREAYEISRFPGSQAEIWVVLALRLCLASFVFQVVVVVVDVV